MKTLFKNAIILQRGEDNYFVIKDGFLLVNGEFIEYIGKEKPKGPFDKEIDAKGKLLMPGLINAHCHAAMTLLRGVGSGLNLEDWLTKAIFPIEEKLTPKDNDNGVDLAIMEMLSTGTTAFADMYFFPYSTAKRVAKAKIKANICRTNLCFDETIDMKDCPTYQETIHFVKSCAGDKTIYPEMVSQLGSTSFDGEFKSAIEKGRIKADLCIHSEYLTSEKFAKEIAEDNKELNAKIQIHVSETEKEVINCQKRRGSTSFEYFQKCGVLGHDNVIAAHCVHLQGIDYQIMKAHDVSLVHNPSSNLKLGSGIADIRRALDEGINVALATDGCASNNNLDMFEELHIAALIAAGSKKNALAISTKEVIDMATVNGAKALGRNDTGKLEVGYKADIIAIDLSKPHLHPSFDIPALIVYSMQGSDVCLTMVDGQILYENGKYLTINEKATYEKVASSIKRLGLE